VAIVTTARGAESLARIALPANVTIDAVPAESPVGAPGLRAGAVIEAARHRGTRLALLEGGPHLMADFVAEGLLDELFLTVAPQIAGRDQVIPRLALVEGIAFAVGAAPWLELRSVRRSGDHLFLRYSSRTEAGSRS
jgi:riboflavin biosynthesis pyrimidine reductase